MTMDMQKLEEVATACWTRYREHMDAGRMRQRPGRSEYTIEMIRAGLVPAGQKGWATVFEEIYLKPKSPAAKLILSVERRMKKPAPRQPVFSTKGAR